MLVKMIQYDLRFGAKKYALMAALTAGLMLLAAIGKLIDSEIMTVFAITFAVLASVAYLILYVVISIQHLYSQLCGRESYLSYSLPVSIHTLLLSKLICILFWSLVTTLLLALFWLVGVECIFLRPEGQSLIQMIRDGIGSLPPEAWAEIKGTFPFGAALILVSAVQQVAQFGLCIGLVNVPALKERNLGAAAGIVAYLFGSQVIGLLQLLVFWLSERTLHPGTSFMNMNSTAEGTRFLIVMIVSGVILTAAYYMTAAHLIGKRRSI